MNTNRSVGFIRILGVRVDNVDQSQAAERILALWALGRPCQVVTINPEFIMRARHDPAFRAVLEAADLALPDGVGLIWASHILGTPLRGRATGVQTTLDLAVHAAQHGLSFFLLGAEPGVAEQAAARLVTVAPGLRIAGTFAGSPSPADDEQIVGLIRPTAPDFLLVAFGAPQQDLWIARNQPRLGLPVAMGVGGAFDYLSGRARWPAAFWRRLGLEWLCRLAQQPRRWRRMLALPRFALLVLGSRLRGRQDPAK